MIARILKLALPLLSLSCIAAAQVFSFPTAPANSIGMTNMADMAMNAVQASVMDFNLWQINSHSGGSSPLATPGGTVSKLDLKAPGKARRAYDKGYELLMKKDMPGAVKQLTVATLIYPDFVAAHNALGNAYLTLGQNDQARGEFAHAISLDDHLPNSYLNLGCAQIALKDYPAAQKSIEKASSLAPLDLQLLTALAYGQFMNHDYPATIATAQKVHERKHEGAAMVHLYAAAAWQVQNKLPEAESELTTFLREDPNSTAAAQARQMMQEIHEQQKHPAPTTIEKVTFTQVPSDDAPTGSARIPAKIQQMMQASKESAEIAEAEAAANCPTCASAESSPPAEANLNVAAGSLPSSEPSGTMRTGYTFRTATDEVALFFAATDHGKSVIDLTGKDVGIQDDRKAPAAITGFRNEAQLPLRLGLVIDTSASISARFKFEQDAAANFVRKVMTGQRDQAFVIGFANSVLLVQDFTGDQQLISRAIGELVPSGGTALWDAVAFAAEKLGNQPETQPVARVLVVLSDGEDNSSSVTFKQAIERAEHGEVAVYTVSTREDVNLAVHSLVGEHALNTLAELTGGAAFTPGSAHRLNSSLADLQQVIRSRYLVSYKPALFKRDGQYHAIDITAAKDGHRLRVYARKGYFAVANSPGAGSY
ncbi:MAG: VWA domain-containing protein [Terriglobales bacterium]